MDGLATHPRPALEYGEALARLETLRDGEGETVQPFCRTKFLSHHQQTAQVILCLHGLGHCPQQFQKLSLHLYKLGYNALTTRLPYHGLEAGQPPNLADLTAEDLAAHTDTVVDIGRGLGRQVTLVGFSAGGVMAAWAAQQRTDIDQAVLIAPFFSHRLIPNALNRVVVRLVMRLPNVPLRRPPWAKADSAAHPVHSFPASHTLGQVVRLGVHTQSLARQAPPQAGRVTMVLNPHDPVVNNRVPRDLAAWWRRHGYNQLEIYDLNEALRLPHNIVDPGVKKQNGALVHPLLIHLITRRATNAVI